MKEKLSLTVNGQTYTVNVEPDTPLLYVLRNQLELNGPKYGCGLEQCGSCMVLVDGQASPSCRLPVAATTGKNHYYPKRTHPGRWELASGTASL